MEEEKHPGTWHFTRRTAGSLPIQITWVGEGAGERKSKKLNFTAHLRKAFKTERATWMGEDYDFPPPFGTRN